MLIRKVQIKNDLGICLTKVGKMDTGLLQVAADRYLYL